MGHLGGGEGCSMWDQSPTGSQTKRRHVPPKVMHQRGCRPLLSDSQPPELEKIDICGFRAPPPSLWHFVRAA